MSLRLENKTVLVTAAGQGIALASAKRFALEGVRVYAVDINQIALDSLSNTEGVIPLCIDLTDTAACSAMIDEIDASDDSTFTTGQAMAVDGGWSL